MLQTWCEREIDRTRGYDPQGYVYSIPFASPQYVFNQLTRGELENRIRLLNEAIARLGEMKKEVVTESDILTALAKIYASIPPSPTA